LIDSLEENLPVATFSPQQYEDYAQGMWKCVITKAMWKCVSGMINKCSVLGEKNRVTSMVGEK